MLVVGDSSIAYDLGMAFANATDGSAIAFNLSDREHCHRKADRMQYRTLFGTVC